MEELTEAADLIFSKIDEETDICWTALVDEKLKDQVVTTIFVAGIPMELNRWE